MDEKKDWLEKVLDDASADVKAWPSWMKDDADGVKSPQTEAKSETKKDNNRRRSASA
jgi:hypothetical protein